MTPVRGANALSSDIHFDSSQPPATHHDNPGVRPTGKRIKRAIFPIDACSANFNAIRPCGTYAELCAVLREGVFTLSSL